MDKAQRSTVIRGGELLVSDPEHGLRLERGDLLIRGERIVAMGQIEEPPTGTRVIWAAGCVVMPGFVQGHLSLGSTLLRGLASTGRDLETLQRAHTAQSLRAAAQLAVAELLLNGTTAVQAIEPGPEPAPILEVLAETGLYASFGRAVADNAAAFPEIACLSTAEALRAGVDLAEEWDGAADGRIRICLSARGADACTEPYLLEMAALAAAGGWRIHLPAATDAEAEARLARRTGRSSIRYLSDLGIVGERVSLAGCQAVEAADCERLAAEGTAAVLRPRFDARRGAGVAPVRELTKRGVRLSLGSGNAASNDTFDMFRELEFITLGQSAGHGRGALAAAAALDMPMRAGAEVLGWTGEMGVLVEGAIANVVLVGIQGLHVEPSVDRIEALVHACRSTDVQSVWLGGQQVVAEGRLTTLDQEAIRRQARRESVGLLARADA